MSKIVLYTNHCPACDYLKSLLDKKNIPYEVCSDEEVMRSMGMTNVPMLQVYDTILDNATAVRWAKEAPDHQPHNTVDKSVEENSQAQKEINAFCKTTGYEKYDPYLKFIKDYTASSNAATGSKVDANANVENKNVTTLTGELYKTDGIGINRLRMHRKISEMFGRELADEYIRQLEAHEIYRHDESHPMLPYCVSITMYPFLYNGLTTIGGGSTAPHNLDSFTGSFINMCFAIASQFAGALSTPEWLSYMDYFIRKEYGDDYYKHSGDIVDLSNRKRSLAKIIHDKFEQVVYSLNQPAGARSYQSIFWNIAYFDKPYFDGMFSNFVFPDGSKMQWESVSWLQKEFMQWFNKERTKTVLTFPVETLNLLDDGTGYVDKEWADFAATMLSEGHSFFIYRSNSVDSLASCCRLRNEMQDNTFSYTLGAGGVSTGSKGVITVNMNRLIQNACKGIDENDDVVALICDQVKLQVRKVHKYLMAFNELLKESYDAGMLPVYSAGFISLQKQYLTIGINGFVEGAEFLGYEISPDDSDYVSFVNRVLQTIYTENKNAKTNDCMFNTEYVPAENLGVKNAKWDREDGYNVPRDCYNSYFYLPEEEMRPLDKFMLHGTATTRYLDGGSALHLNLDEHLSKSQYRQLLDVAIKTGCPYWTVNVPNTICNDCGHISKHHLAQCPQCHSTNLDYITRIIGYLKRVSNFSEARQKEAGKRYYAK